MSEEIRLPTPSSKIGGTVERYARDLCSADDAPPCDDHLAEARRFVASVRLNRMRAHARQAGEAGQ